jgi:hypothetical protein
MVMRKQNDSFVASAGRVAATMPAGRWLPWLPRLHLVAPWSDKFGTPGRSQPADAPAGKNGGNFTLGSVEPGLDDGVTTRLG